jgi:hypothetical protein
MIDGYLCRWKTRRLSDISPDDVARLHDMLGNENGRYAANRTLALLRTMFNLAREWRFFSGRIRPKQSKYSGRKSANAFYRRMSSGV